MKYLCGIPLHELHGVLVCEILKSFDDLWVPEVVLPQQARLDVLLVNPLVHVSQPETNQVQ